MTTQAPAGTNICGVLVFTRPGKTDSAARAIALLPGSEIHHTTGDGRLVITIEDTAAAMAAETMTQICNIDGVINTSLVYHHTETDNT